jgi:hypothetical protein
MTKLPDHSLYNKPEQAIVAFYLNQRPDSKRRMIEDMWLWDYQKLEYTHDYIQWLFPLQKKSRFNPDAPLLNDQAIQAFRTNEQLRSRLRKSLEVMLSFYGLQANERANEPLEVTLSDEFPERKTVWLKPGNHNYLRITRILTSLKLLGLEKDVQAFKKGLDQIYAAEGDRIGSETYRFWENAVILK